MVHQRTKVTKQGATIIDLSDDEINVIKNERAERERKAPLKDWEQAMRESDSIMTREMENHIEFDHGGISADENSQLKYLDKKAKRAQKPK